MVHSSSRLPPLTSAVGASCRREAQELLFFLFSQANGSQRNSLVFFIMPKHGLAVGTIGE